MHVKKNCNQPVNVLDFSHLVIFIFMRVIISRPSAAFGRIRGRWTLARLEIGVGADGERQQRPDERIAELHFFLLITMRSQLGQTHRSGLTSVITMPCLWVIQTGHFMSVLSEGAGYGRTLVA